ncbi:MAG: thioredoxin family protein [Saprospiraceae bacterium]
MKKILILALICSFSVSIFAQEGISFNHGDWSEVLATAKKENKIVFVDAFTVWCGPCKWMAKNSFPDKAVGEFFNENFINAKIDMEKGEGIEIAKKFEVRAYPTLLFVNGDGELVHRAVGARDAAGLLELGKVANNPETQIMGMVKRFEKGDRDAAFLKNYAAAANEAGMPNSKEVGNAYLKTQKDLLTEENIKFIFGNTSSPKDAYYSFMVKNKAKFADVVGAEKVNGLLKSVIGRPFYRNNELDFADVTKAYSEVFSKENAAKYTAEFKMNYYGARMRGEGFKEKFLNAAVDYLENHDIQNSQTLNSIAWSFYENTTDKKLLKKACGWAEKSVDLDSNYANNDTVAAICYSLGKKRRAKKFATKAIELGKADGSDVSSTEELLNKINSL